MEISFEYRYDTIFRNINLASATENMIKFIVCPDLNKGEVTTDGAGARMSGKSRGEKMTVKND